MQHPNLLYLGAYQYAESYFKDTLLTFMKDYLDVSVTEAYVRDRAKESIAEAKEKFARDIEEAFDALIKNWATIPCEECGGRGDCGYCNEDGYVSDAEGYEDEHCDACLGYNKCNYCHGSGLEYVR